MVKSADIIESATQMKPGIFDYTKKDEPVFGAQIELLKSIMFQRVPDLEQTDSALDPFASAKTSVERLGRAYEEERAMGKNEAYIEASRDYTTIQDAVNQCLGKTKTR